MPQGLGLLRTEPRPRSRAPAPPRLKSGAAGSEAPAHKPPLAPECLVPCGWEPIPDPGGLSYISSKLRTPTKRWTSAPGELRKVITCSPGFLGPGAPAASVLGSHSACGRQRHQHRRSGGAGHFWERGRYGGKSFQTRTLGSFFQHILPEATTQDTTFSRALVAQPPQLGAETCCRLVDVFSNYKRQSGASGG